MSLKCNCGNTKFKLKILKEEGLGLCTCSKCNINYLLLDSIDYWYDAIQSHNPKNIKCSCKNDIFELSPKYYYREGYKDIINYIELFSTCDTCKKEKNQYSQDIDYSPTEDLVTKPLTKCDNPIIKYKLKEISLYIKNDDLFKIINFLFLNLHLNSKIVIYKNNKWEMADFNTENINIINEYKYMSIYFSKNKLDLYDYNNFDTKDEEIFWKRNEIIKINSPVNILFKKLGFLYYIKYSLDYIDKIVITKKSNEFMNICNSFEDFLKKEFVTNRGKNCYDNLEEQKDLFGDKFLK